MKKALFILCTLMMALPLLAQEEYSDIRKGNKAFEKGNFSDAEVSYRRALQKNPNSLPALYNLGNALYRQEKYEDAQKAYIRASTQANKKGNEQKLAKAYHNLGNSFFAMQQFDKAIDAYKKSLRLNPSDNETRYNLVKAMQQQKQQQQEQQPQQQPQEQQQDQNQMDEQTAEQLLQALEQDEQENQEKAQKVQSKQKDLEKDW